VLTLHLTGRAMVPALTVRDRQAMLSFSYVGPNVEGAYHGTDLSLAVVCATMRRLCGPKWVPTETHIVRREPTDGRPYRQFFGSPVRFGASRAALVFPASLLDRPVEGADPAERKRIEQVMSDVLRRGDLELTSRVRRALFAQMTQDDASIEGVARLLGMHKRTLNRRLAEQDTSFPKLLGEVRFQIARQLLVETDLPFIDVAGALNYDDASAFSRAFRSWAGMLPLAWRRKHTT
jgi:AraC-like DNA-binding protein